MIDAAVEQVCEWLEDPATGVNEQILAMPLDAGAPNPPLLVQSIYSESEHAWVARVFQGQPLDQAVASVGPALLVGSANTAGGDLRVDNPGGGRVSVDVAICYVGRNDRSEELVRDARQTFRACLRAVLAPFAEDIGRAVRRGGVDVEHPALWRLVALAGASTSTGLYGGLLLSIPTVDPWALGIGS